MYCCYFNIILSRWLNTVYCGWMVVTKVIQQELSREKHCLNFVQEYLNLRCQHILISIWMANQFRKKKSGYVCHIKDGSNETTLVCTIVHFRMHMYTCAQLGHANSCVCVSVFIRIRLNLLMFICQYIKAIRKTLDIITAKLAFIGTQMECKTLLRVKPLH